MSARLHSRPHRRALLAAFMLMPLAPALAGSLVGTRHDGTPWQDSGGWRLIYFGYTRCPDVCPLGLQSIAEAMDALGPMGEKLTPVFVTVDPERDTPSVMKDYVAFFHPRLSGISPSDEQLQAMAREWRIKYRKVEVGEGRPYLMDHTASVLLVKPDGRIGGRFPHDLGGEAMAQKIRFTMDQNP